jgi:hypothetical protein
MSNDSLENMRKKMQDLEARLTKENPPGSPKANDMVTMEAKAIEWILVAGDYLASLRSEEFAKAKILKLSVKNDDLVRENDALRNQIRDLNSELAARPKNPGIRNPDDEGDPDEYEDLDIENMALRTRLKKAMDELKFFRNADRIIGSDLTDSEVIQRLNQGKSIREVSRELGIPYSTVRRIYSEKRSK